MAEAARQVYESKILRVDEIAPQTRLLCLDRPPGLQFAPGQFLSFLMSVDGQTLTKPYTVASDPENAECLEIVLNLVPGGAGSHHLFQIQAGDLVRFTGPWGSFKLERRPAAETVFIAESTGIAAIRPMLRRALAQASPLAVHLHHNAAAAELLLYRGEWETAARRHGEFEYHPLIGADLVSLIDTRYVQRDSERGRHFFICGIGDVVYRLRDLLRGAGYERRAVQYEKW